LWETGDDASRWQCCKFGHMEDEIVLRTGFIVSSGCPCGTSGTTEFDDLGKLDESQILYD